MSGLQTNLNSKIHKNLTIELKLLYTIMLTYGRMNMAANWPFSVIDFRKIDSKQHVYEVNQNVNINKF